ncbi:MAG: uroporphyrinogen-III C-methyltransferase [Deltaproteobacteria bacterium]|nr:uroporphyrinogen-III C-methyltransferase [Deltaproteobacteria bacterium]
MTTIYQKKGKVYLIGAGPGDPGLLTLKAKACIERADVVVYDYLANQAFLEYAHSETELIYVGKQGGAHTMKQEDINALLCEKAGQGLNIVRLKGGDPFIFGRGGEEAQELVKAGVPFEVIPGITSAIAVPAYAGIPLTHRDYTATVAFVTGHEEPNKVQSNMDWEKLATGIGTLVFLMGIGNLAEIAENLIHHGRTPDTPVAVIQQGTMAKQKTVVGTLRNIAVKAKERQVRPPGIIVIGEVVNLRAELNWFEQKPLFGKRIIITRAREQASEFLAQLTELGAECIEFPTIEIIPPSQWEDMDRAIRSLDRYQWLLFTSVNGVQYFFKRLEDLGKDVRGLKNMKVGAIGPKTAEAVYAKGIKPDLVPDEYRAEAVVDAFKKQGAENLNILIPRAAEAREILPEELKKMGARVDVVEAYRTVMPDKGADKVKAMLQDGEIHMITFTSSSTVTNFVSMFESDKDQLKHWMEKSAVACIGPITAQTAEKNGLKVSVMPKDYTVEALTDAILQYYS